MSTNSLPHGLYTERVAVGLSSVIGVTAGAYARGFILNMYAVGGTLEIHGATGNVWGTGYRVAPSTQVTLPGPVSFWLTSTGATSIVDVIKLRSIDPISGV